MSRLKTAWRNILARRRHDSERTFVGGSGCFAVRPLESSGSNYPGYILRTGCFISRSYNNVYTALILYHHHLEAIKLLVSVVLVLNIFGKGLWWLSWTYSEHPRGKESGLHIARLVQILKVRLCGIDNKTEHPITVIRTPLHWYWKSFEKQRLDLTRFCSWSHNGQKGTRCIDAIVAWHDSWHHRQQFSSARGGKRFAPFVSKLDGFPSDIRCVFFVWRHEDRVAPVREKTLWHFPPNYPCSFFNYELVRELSANVSRLHTRNDISVIMARTRTVVSRNTNV